MFSLRFFQLKGLTVHHLGIKQSTSLDIKRCWTGPRFERTDIDQAHITRTYGKPSRSFFALKHWTTDDRFKIQYLIANLGMSRGFGPVDLANLPFPVHMRIDYIRVYQPRDAINIGCDPKDFPTAQYIET